MRSEGAVVGTRTGRDRRIAAAFWLALTAVFLLALISPSQPANAAVKKEEFPVSDAGSDQLDPAVDGNIAVWKDNRSGVSSIYGKNLSTNQEFLVATGVSVRNKPVTNGKVVVWEDDRSGNSDIYGYRIPADLSTTGEEFLIASGPGDQRKPAISGNTVVWEDNRAGRFEILKYDLAAQQESVVATGTGNMTNPAISGNTVVWQDDGGVTGNSDIYARDLTTEQVIPVATDESFADTPAISGNIVVWRQESVGNYDIFGKDLYAKDIETGKVFQITTDASDQVAPAISGNLVVWEDHRNGNADVYGKDLRTGEEFQVSTGATEQSTPEINGETVVWETQVADTTNFGSYDVYGARLDAAPAAPGGLTARGSAGGIQLDWNAVPEDDIVGYNVYRGDSADGVYTKISGAAPQAGTSFLHADATAGVRVFYKVKAVDGSGSESAAAQASGAIARASQITLSADKTTLTYSGTTTLSGRLTSGAGLAGRAVILEQKPEGASTYSPVSNGRLITGADGAFSLSGVRADKNTDFRARFVSGEDEVASSVSSPVRVTVQQLISVKASARFITLGQRITFYGTILPAHTGQVKLTIKHNGAIVDREMTLLNSSRYRMSYKPLVPGRYQVTATFGTQPYTGTTNVAYFTMKR